MADGRDQLVRQFGRCDWSSGLSALETETYKLETCIRMKSGLINFANRLAEKLDLVDWALRTQDSLPGGRVILRIGSFSREDQEHIARENALAKNRNIDMLYCVDPSSIVVSAENGSRTSTLSDALRNWGYEVWDAVDREERRTFPTSLDQCRVVQFESSRGLEGWTVILSSLDKFFEIKASSVEPTSGDGLVDQSLRAEALAAQWTMIPITRAIDTLIINIADANSRLGSILVALADEMPDTVQILP